MRFKWLLASSFLPVVLLYAIGAEAQNIVSNTDESKVPAYTLPDPLLTSEGKKVNTKEEWTNSQRAGIYRLFEENVYGRYPSKKCPLIFEVREDSSSVLGGLARRKQVRIYFNAPENKVWMDLLIYLPVNSKKPVPVFTGLNFSGNQSVAADPGIFLAESWVDSRVKGSVNNRVTDSARGTGAGQWQLPEIIGHGYGLVTAYYGDLEPDNPDGWKTGIRSRLQQALDIRPDEWGAIGAWAWGLSRIMDYIEKDKDMDSKKVSIIGHSRLGKAALWAAASDQRFSLVVSNESGEGGAALSKRWYGETVAIINQKFPHWFVAKYKSYGEHTDALPVDQHMLLALMAPRPLYVASAEGDQWSDPKGELLGAFYAGKVYALFGRKGIPSDRMPGLHEPVGDVVRYHIRAGKHDVTSYDWQQYLAFADKYFHDANF